MIDLLNKNNKVKLFCLPYAGSSTTVYSRWKPYIQEHIELCPLELSGRGNRFKEPLYSDFEDAIEDMYNLLCNNLDTENYAIFGHSLGSLLAYELSYMLAERKKTSPKHIFVSGSHPPYTIRENRNLHKLPDDKFMEEVYKYGGTPRELLSNNKLLSIFLPILKCDYRVFETYNRNTLRKHKLKSNITSFNGIEDKNINREDIVFWKECISGSYEGHLFEGGHFFINNNIHKIVNIINRTLNDYIAFEGQVPAAIDSILDEASSE